MSATGMRRQPEAEAGETLMEMPSFRSICGGEGWPRPLLGGLDEAGSAGRPVGASEEDFEFWCVDSRDSLDGFELVAAEEVFSGGRIRPVSLQLHAPAVQCPDPGDGSDDANNDVNEDDAYAIGEVKEPVDFSLSLRVFLAGDEKLTSTSSSASSDELESVPAKSYCLWAPRSAPESPDLGKKSHCMGAGSRKWRLLLDLVTRRSHSEGKGRFALVAEKKDKNKVEKKDKKKGEQQRTAATRAENKGKGAGRGGGKAVSGMDMEAAHRFYYMKGGAEAADRRRSFLPYRRDLLGFFPHVSLAGRSIHAF